MRRHRSERSPASRLARAAAFAGAAWCVGSAWPLVPTPAAFGQEEPSPPPARDLAEEATDALENVRDSLEKSASEVVATDARRRNDAITGVERPASEPGDTPRNVGSALLFLPREALDFVFWSTSAAVGVIENEQVVPRVQQYVSGAGGRIAVLPTAFIETGRPLNFGVRMITDTGFAATSIRAGFGGFDSVVIEPRVAFHLRSPLRSIVSAELLYQRDTDIDYLGVGQDPATDPRNLFLPGRAGVEALYFERRVRAILGYAARLTDDIEIALSTSFNRRQVLDVDDPDTLGAVFEPDSVPGAFEETWILYTELAARVDTRPTRGRPSSGFRYEMYAGSAREAQGDPIAFVRAGGRLAAFVPVARPTNILSSQVALDALKPLSLLEVPFTELPRQPDFRGIDNRRDLVSLVGNIDYRWLLAESLGARLFWDTALVAPEVLELDPTGTRWATGFGLDVHSESHQIGDLAFSVSPEGFRFLLSIGVSSGYGDRQHRD